MFIFFMFSSFAGNVPKEVAVDALLAAAAVGAAVVVVVIAITARSLAIWPAIAPRNVKAGTEVAAAVVVVDTVVADTGVVAAAATVVDAAAAAVAALSATSVKNTVTWPAIVPSKRTPCFGTLETGLGVD